MKERFVQIRVATEADAAELVAIYKEYIESAVTFECSLPTVDAFSSRIRGILREYPYLLCEADGVVVGYAYAHRQAERAAYRWNAELSVYLSPAACGLGIGTALYTALLQLLQLQGIRNAYGVVTSPNPASERLHASLGFRMAGVHHSTGYKCGKWHDVLFFEKALGGGDPPKEVVPFSRLESAAVQEILQRYEMKIPRQAGIFEK